MEPFLEKNVFNFGKMIKYFYINDLFYSNFLQNEIYFSKHKLSNKFTLIPSDETCLKYHRLLFTVVGVTIDQEEI